MENYDNFKIKRETRIKGKCKTDNCKETFDKSFRQLAENNSPYCSCCSINIGKEKAKKHFLEKYGCEFYLQTKEKQFKSKQTCIEKYGVENCMQNEEIRNKVKQTCIEKYGVENPNQNKEIQEKIKKTNTEKYGFENPFQNKGIREKMEETMIERYGVKYTAQNKELREKIEETMVERYGAKYTTQNKELLDKVKHTFLEKYGVENPFQSDEFKNKSKQTCLKKYGVEYPMQNSEIMKKMSKNAYKLKDYTFPSGSQIQYQGYENYALDQLLQSGILEEDIINGCKNVPKVWYEDTHGKKHRYYVDIFIPNQNRCIEVKSTWTAEKKKDNIFLKQQALKDAGYACEIWIYNRKGEKIECYK